MVEGAGSDDYRLVKTMLYRRPDLMHRILAVNADSVAAYLNAQVRAGAQALMIFDSWGGVLADGAFQAFSLAYTRRVLGQLVRESEGRPCHIVFTKAAASGSTRLPRAGARRGRTRLDDEPRRGAGKGRQPRCVAGQPRPQRAVRRARQIEAEVVKVLKLRHASRRFRPRLQPGSRHQPAHAARKRRIPGSLGTRSFAANARIWVKPEHCRQRNRRLTLPLRRIQTGVFPIVEPLRCRAETMRFFDRWA
jgi:hypothetical protein